MEIFTADQIRDITEHHIKETYSDILAQIFNECKRAAQDNSYQVTLYGINIDDILKKYLETLGYTLEKSENSINYIIVW